MLNTNRFLQGETADYMKKITADRKEEHESFQKAQSDDKAAVKLLNLAKDALQNARYCTGKLKTHGILAQACPGDF